MYLHTVMMSFNKEMTAALRAQIESFFNGIPVQCKGIERFDFVDNMSRLAKGYTHALVSVFSSEETLDTYRLSAAHDKLMTELAPHLKEILVLDGALTERS